MDSLHLTLEDEPISIQSHFLPILAEYLQPTNTTTPETAAIALDNLHPDKRREEKDKESGDVFVYYFFEPFHAIAKQIPHTHPAQGRLVDLVKALRELPSRSVHLSQWGDYELWKDLPLFGETFSDAYFSDNDKPLDKTTKNTRFLNLTSYAARLLGINLIPNDSYCIWALSDALEGRYDSGKGRLRNIITDPTADPEVDIHVAVAVEWIVHAGAVLYRRGEAPGGDYHGPLIKGPGKKAFSKERWALWKSRFAEFGECEGLKEETRVKAREAVSEMETVERSTEEL
ncbi:hypothetical protein ASPWEDRAFT_27920 [Aspergillus wentii DTO 134E9]|uniref:Uncharacterized protein n=1 Tax=Aspergillus wentii DTO 134E9 TaxID=1073089 RepID=A0A1L9RK31_ASPWE|nr:uncharacterized protein ASPWEDRAFT_27920 [Aspergillus wentii DTO 134E9]KAI9923599.1 hypothetical protein MW887_008521 [Aspergillus wentii]OJJ35263.1 hypothetical protein ASPWEDRAFT_27920 [Aspergillus wentii DTO 134E9]